MEHYLSAFGSGLASPQTAPGADGDGRERELFAACVAGQADRISDLLTPLSLAVRDELLRKTNSVSAKSGTKHPATQSNRSSLLCSRQVCHASTSHGSMRTFFASSLSTAPTPTSETRYAQQPHTHTCPLPSPLTQLSSERRHVAARHLARSRRPEIRAHRRKHAQRWRRRRDVQRRA